MLRMVPLPRVAGEDSKSRRARAYAMVLPASRGRAEKIERPYRQKSSSLTRTQRGPAASWWAVQPSLASTFRNARSAAMVGRYQR